MSDPVVEKEVKKLFRKIDKYHNEKDFQSMSRALTSLRAQPITLEILKSTKIGKEVNQLRQRVENNDVKKQMRNLIKLWKNLNEGPGGDGAGQPQVVKREKVQAQKQTSQTQSTNGVRNDLSALQTQTQPRIQIEQKTESFTSNNVYITPIDYCGDQNRDKARDLIGKALRSKFPDILHSKCNQCAVQLEKGLNDVYGENMKKYKLQLMSKISNLKDDKNPSLRESFINGAITGQQLAEMSPADMASKELKVGIFLKEKEQRVATSRSTDCDIFVCFKLFHKKALLIRKKRKNEKRKSPRTSSSRQSRYRNRHVHLWEMPR